jgi:hypothetical protein
LKRRTLLRKITPSLSVALQDSKKPLENSFRNFDKEVNIYKYENEKLNRIKIEKEA